MKLLIDVPDNKASTLLEFLNSISYLKAKPITRSKALLIEELKEAVQEMNAIKAGKTQAREAAEFLNEL